MAARGLAAIAALVGCLSGCARASHQLYAFPDVWPGSAPLGAEAPRVLVQPLRRDRAMFQQPDAAPGLPSDAVLSALLMKHLEVSGIKALLEPGDQERPEYVLECSVPRLGYDVESGYPRSIRYRAELSCTVRDAATQAVVWQRSLSQAYDRTEVWNMLASLGARPHEHERVLFQECIVPLWDAMASSVGAALASRRDFPPLPERSGASALQ